ncbi:MAG: MazG-like family protein [Eubacteriales bacterium]|nr:MazG-like family protein [Eubacteriales bacterium]
MNDKETTVGQLSEAIRALCVEKNWGREGEQNPQHVAMAMSVEMAELLEHFQWLEPQEVEALWAGEDPQRAEKIAEEFADVMMYGLQLMYVLKMDISAHIEKKIDRVLKRPEHYYEDKRRLREDFEQSITQ